MPQRLISNSAELLISWYRHGTVPAGDQNGDARSSRGDQTTMENLEYVAEELGSLSDRFNDIEGELQAKFSILSF